MKSNAETVDEYLDELPADRREAIEAVREHGASIAGVLCLVYREEGARERLGELGLPLVAAFTGSELLTAAVAASGS